MRVHRTDPRAILPRYATDGAAGLDLHACGAVEVGLEWVRIPTGIAIELPPGHEGQIRPRSSATLAGLDVALGTIDQDYRGPISILARCLEGPHLVLHGDRIAQLVVSPVARVEVVEGELSETARGAGGFGSTGR